MMILLGKYYACLFKDKHKINVLYVCTCSGFLSFKPNVSNSDGCTWIPWVNFINFNCNGSGGSEGDHMVFSHVASAGVTFFGVCIEHLCGVHWILQVNFKRPNRLTQNLSINDLHFGNHKWSTKVKSSPMTSSRTIDCAPIGVAWRRHAVACVVCRDITGIAALGLQC